MRDFIVKPQFAVPRTARGLDAMNAEIMSILRNGKLSNKFSLSRIIFISFRNSLMILGMLFRGPFDVQIFCGAVICQH